MALLTICALSVLLLASSYLLFLEVRRFIQDRSPAPPPTPEEASLDRWNAGVVMLVAVVSIIGAMTAFWASNKFSDASTMSQQSLQEASQYQTVKAEQDGYVQFGARLSELYQEHTVAASQLYTEAATARQAGNPNGALLLEAQARVEGAQERALSPGFFCYEPTNYGSDGTVTYSISQEEQSEAEDACTQPDQDPSSLRTLDQAHVLALETSAASERSTAEDVVLSGALLIVAVFFMTLSYLGWRHRRIPSLAAGVLSLAGALAVAVSAGLS
jgi:hypothetical protein